MFDQVQPVTAILGAGSWGTALAILLARNGIATRLWGHDPLQMQDLANARVNARYLPQAKFPDSLQIYSDLPNALEGVKDIIIVVPSFAFVPLLTNIKNLISEDARIVWGTKGLDPESGLLLSTKAKEIFGTKPLAILSGPSFAHEVALGLPTAITLAANDELFAQQLAAQLHNQHFRVYLADDMVGVGICGVVKNILAIAAGVIDGLKLGANALSALITRGLAEMMRLGNAMGANPMTFVGLAGVGDLILTCSSPQSRNRRFGAEIARGKTVDEALQNIGQVVEGWCNLKTIYKLAKSYQVEMPITEQIYKALYENLPPEEAIENLFARDLKPEVY